MTKIKSPRVLRSLLPAVLVGALAVGGWYCYAWVLPGRAGPANSDKVSKASGIARTELDRRLAETLATLPGHPELLGDATLDRCLWSGSFEGAKAGEINCQRMQARYVAVEGAPAEVAGQWKAALESRGWSGSSAPLPPGTGYTAVRDHYNDPSNQDFLSVTLVGDRASMALLDNDIPLGGFSEYRRDLKEFGDRGAAERALAAGRQVVQLSMARTYYFEGPRLYLTD
ncbi:hypothetical protein ACWCYY_15740 [Kitasatospora sp. NPDC001664]